MHSDPNEPNVIRLAPAGAAGGRGSWDVLLGRQYLCSPFDVGRQAVLHDFSTTILASSELRREPSAVSLAYWLRRAQLQRIRVRCEGATPSGVIRTPVGTVFHIAPSNVDTMFVYSWALSFLLGNNNVVRISATAGAIVRTLIALINKLMATNPSAWRGNFFISYGHNDAITEYFSARCDHRIIWGGDETVRRIRAVPFPPHASERAFASKFSFSVVAADALLRASDDEVARAGRAFSDDIKAFGQKACSSPHVLFWVAQGEEVLGAAKQRFAAALLPHMVTDDVGAAVTRIERVFAVASEGAVAAAAVHPGLVVLEARSQAIIRAFEVGGCVVTHFVGSSLAEALALVDRHTQTITYFGFSNEELAVFATKAGALGCDRIVPFGQALNFDAVWDGFDLMGDFSRLVTVST